MDKKLKRRAQGLANRHKEKLNVILSCACECFGEKIIHHIDYNRPYDVYKLCPCCHSSLHAKDRDTYKGRKHLIEKSNRLKAIAKECNISHQHFKLIYKGICKAGFISAFRMKKLIDKEFEWWKTASKEEIKSAIDSIELGVL